MVCPSLESAMESLQSPPLNDKIESLFVLGGARAYDVSSHIHRIMHDEWPKSPEYCSVAGTCRDCLHHTLAKNTSIIFPIIVLDYPNPFGQLQIQAFGHTKNMDIIR